MLIKYAFLAMFALIAAPAMAQAAKQETAPAPKPRFTLDTPIEQIVADPKGKEAFNSIFPGMLESEFFVGVKYLSLRGLESQGYTQYEQMRQMEALLPKL